MNMHTPIRKSVGAPTAGDLHFNQTLTNFAQKFLQDEDRFIATRACPNIPVSHQSDKYWEFRRADFFRNSARKRADSTESPRIGYNVSQSPYFCDIWALGMDVSDRAIKNADPGLNPKVTAVEVVMGQLMISREIEFRDTIFTPANWTAYSEPAVNWSSPTSTPITDIATGQRTVQAATGFRPNKAIISRLGYDTLMQNDEILSRIIGGADPNQPAKVRLNHLAMLFELDEIHIMESVFNSAADGAAENTDFIAGDHFLLYYAPNTVSFGQPTAMAQFSWTGYTGQGTKNGISFGEFYEDRIKSTVVEGEMAYSYKIISQDLGYCFSSVSS